MVSGIIMTESYYCEECPENKYEDCGPWTESNSELFKNVKQIHQNHKGWQEYNKERIYAEKTKFGIYQFTNYGSVVMCKDCTLE